MFEFEMPVLIIKISQFHHFAIGTTKLRIRFIW